MQSAKNDEINIWYENLASSHTKKSVNKKHNKCTNRCPVVFVHTIKNVITVTNNIVR